MRDGSMRKLNLEVDGKSYLIATKDEKTELCIKGNTTPVIDDKPYEVEVPNILIITRKNADVLFVLRGSESDSFKIMTAQDLYDKFEYQWLEPLADNYRELLYVNNEDYIKMAYRIFSWGDIAKFSLVDRPLLSYRSGGSGDWKSVPDGGAGFLLCLIENVPYWSDAIGQIPFAVGEYRTFHSIEATVNTGINWATGKPWDALFHNIDATNEYDNFFVLRGALYASKKFTYSTKNSRETYPAVDVVESSREVSAKILGESITEEELENYGLWNEK